MVGQGAHQVPSLIDDCFHRFVLVAPGMTLAAVRIGRMVEREQYRRDQGGKAPQRLKPPLTPPGRQRGEAIVVAHRRHVARQRRVRFLRGATGGGRRRGQAFQIQKQSHHLGVESRGEMLEIPIVYEAGVQGSSLRQHRGGIQHMHIAHGIDFEAVAVTPQVVGERLDDRFDDLVVAQLRLAEAQRQHPSVGQMQPQSGLVVPWPERLPGNPQPCTDHSFTTFFWKNRICRILHGQQIFSWWARSRKIEPETMGFASLNPSYLAPPAHPTASC